jgi:hypothetical protein
MSAPMAVQTGVMANLLEDKAESLNCFLAAADKGDSSAAATTGLYYYVGWGTVVDYKKALYWLQKAGDQDDALTALSAMYQKGQGVPVDLLLGHYLADKVELRKRYRIRYPDASQKPLPGMEGLVNGTGDFFAWVLNLGDKYKIEPLEAKTTHEETILADMHQGMSRVQAEQKFYADLQEQHAAKRVECKLQAVGDKPEYHGLRGAEARRRDEEAAEGAYATCKMIDGLTEASFQEKIRGYRECVEKYGGSNAVEQNCEFPLPRFGF